MISSRRSFLLSLGAMLAAPAVIRTPGLLMPIKRVPIVEEAGTSLPLEELWGDGVHCDGAALKALLRGEAVRYRNDLLHPVRNRDGGYEILLPYGTFRLSETSVVIDKNSSFFGESMGFKFDFDHPVNSIEYFRDGAIELGAPIEPVEKQKLTPPFWATGPKPDRQLGRPSRPSILIAGSIGREPDVLRARQGVAERST